MLITDTSARPAAIPFAVLTALSLAVLGLAAVWSLFDPRLIGGVPVWTKPAKFAVSFVVQFGTLALIVGAMSASARQSWPVKAAGLIMGAAFAVEMGYMILQAAQGEASHFNLSTPVHTFMYGVMGAGAVALVVMPVVVARAARRDDRAGFGPATRAGIWWGALASFGLTMIVGGTMSVAGSALVGVPSEATAVLPLFGWSAEVGDLRAAHFPALHALQALPLAGLWLDRRGGSAAAIPVLAGGWAVFTLALFAQALLGAPLIRL